MRLIKLLAVLVAVGLVFSVGTMCSDQEKAKPEQETTQVEVKKAPEKVFSYVGLKKCKPCHIKHQYKVWMDGPHAKAYEELASEQSLEVAKKLGLKEEPQKSADCLSCHVTAYGIADSLKTAVTLEEGVSCEACHGPGSDYWSMKVMKALTAGEQDPKAVGLWAQTEEMCVKCHNKQSPTYKPFKFKEAVQAIAHPYPKEEGDKK
jgi:hypothetical protein